MSLSRLAATVAVTLLLATAARADEPAGDDLAPLFNGRDLAGWVNVNCAPGTFTVRDGMIVCTGVPTGVMRTDRQYENFILEIEWRHMKPGGNAGLFVWSDPLTSVGVPFTRSIEVQILDGRNTETYTSHGDVFAIHGAKLTPDRPHPTGAMRCLPSEWRCKPAGEWNHYRVTCRDGVLKLAVNGKEVSGGSGCVPRKGYICLESEGSEVHFRNIRLRELPSSNPPAEEIAGEARDFRTLYTGLDLAGWQAGEAHQAHWKPNDWRLACDGRSSGEADTLWSADEYGDLALICDWRWNRAPESPTVPVVVRGIDPAAAAGLELIELPFQRAGRWNRVELTLRGDRLTMSINGQMVVDDEVVPADARGRIGLRDLGVPAEFASIFVLTEAETGE